MKVLIIEDDPDIARQLAGHLDASGFVTQVERDGAEGYFQGATGDYAAILLDIGLPSRDGLSVLKQWRARGVDTPVIVVTARGAKQEVVDGLEAGADDYVRKPFDLAEVTARLRANIKRARGRQAGRLRRGEVRFDPGAGSVTVAGAAVKLTRTEYLIVQCLFLNQGRPVSVSELAEQVYDDFDRDSGVIARHIANIRKKLGDGVIVTESNRGYCVPEDAP